MQFEMTFSKSTKGTHVYNNVADNHPVSVLYIKRESLPKNPPVPISVTIAYDATPANGGTK